MKTFFISALLLLGSGKIFGQFFSKTNLEMPLAIYRNNNIEHIYTYEFKAKHTDKPDSALIKSIDFTYDTEKKFTSQSVFFPKDRVKISMKYFYYENGELKKIKATYPEIQYLSKSGFIPFQNTDYEYDATGKLIFLYNYSDDTSRVYITKNIYNNLDSVVKTMSQYNNQPFRLLETFNYNSLGKLLEHDFYETNGDLDYLLNYEYNINENSVSVFVKKNDIARLRDKFYYNKEGIVLVHTIYGQNTDDDITEKYSYNNDGTLNTTLIYSDKKLSKILRSYYKKI